MSLFNERSAALEGLPQVFGTVIAYRTWKVRVYSPPASDPDVKLPSYLSLVSVAVNRKPWEPYKALDHDCSNPTCRGGPSLDCSCGIYAFKAMNSLPEYVRQINRRVTVAVGETEDLPSVIGEVSLWGKCIEFTKGWRAQYGYPKSIYLPDEASVEYEGVVCRVAANYGVEVKVLPLKQIQKMVFGKEE